jgi:hypothetical protein
MRKRKSKTYKKIRTHDIIALTFDIILLIIAVLPLFSFKHVFFPVNENDKEKYESLGAKIPFGILCGLSIVVSIMILEIVYAFILNLLGDRDPGGFSANSFIIMIPGAIMFYLMLPLYIVYTMHLK